MAGRVTVSAGRSKVRRNPIPALRVLRLLRSLRDRSAGERSFLLFVNPNPPAELRRPGPKITQPAVMAPGPPTGLDIILLLP